MFHFTVNNTVYHTHHAVFGVGLLLLAGYLWVNGHPRPRVRHKRYYAAAVAFGIGAAWVADETSLLFTLDGCSYNWSVNVAAILIGVGLLAPHVFFNRVYYRAATRAVIASQLGSRPG